jgi:hypothetical protein
MQCWEAYLRGEGPKPAPLPCPSWFDSAAWDSRQRRADYLATGEPPPGLTDEEKLQVDGFLQALDQLYAGQPEMPCETTQPLAAPGT